MMNQNPRKEVKRKLDYAIKDVEAIQLLLSVAGEMYAKDHPEIRDQYRVVFAFFEQGKALLEGLRDEY